MHLPNENVRFMLNFKIPGAHPSPFSILSSCAAPIGPWKFRVSQRGSPGIDTGEGYRRSELFWGEKKNALEMPEANVEGPTWRGGTWQAQGHKHGV